MTSLVPHELLTAREVAELMRVSTMTVYRIIKAGELPAIRVGTHLRIRRVDVDAYLDARLVATPGASNRASGAPGHGASASVREEGPWPAA